MLKRICWSDASRHSLAARRASIASWRSFTHGLPAIAGHLYAIGLRGADSSSLAFSSCFAALCSNCSACNRYCLATAMWSFGVFAVSAMLSNLLRSTKFVAAAAGAAASIADTTKRLVIVLIGVIVFSALVGLPYTPITQQQGTLSISAKLRISPGR